MIESTNILDLGSPFQTRMQAFAGKTSDELSRSRLVSNGKAFQKLGASDSRELKSIRLGVGVCVESRSKSNGKFGIGTVDQASIQSNLWQSTRSGTKNSVPQVMPDLRVTTSSPTGSLTNGRLAPTTDDAVVEP